MGKLPDRPIQVGYFGVVREGVQWLEYRVYNRGVITTMGYVIAAPQSHEVEAKRAELAQDLGVSEASPEEDKLALERVVTEELAQAKAEPTLDLPRRLRQQRDAVKAVFDAPTEEAPIADAVAVEAVLADVAVKDVTLGR